jgi:HD-like signal output (HDOD) protein
MLKKPLPDLDSWVEHFSRLEIPVLQHTLVEIRAMRDRFDDIGIRDITRLVKHDPLLSMRLMHYLEARRRSAQVTDVTTLDRVLLMIGMSGFFRVFGSSPVLEEVLASCEPASLRCRRACARAYFAAQIAETIANRHYDISPDEVIGAALLHDCAEILLWVAAPELAYEVLKMLRANPGMRSKAAQKAVLGITLHDLQLALVKAWHLPKLLQQLLDESLIDDPRVRIVQVATSLARHLDNGWHDAGLPDDYQDMADLTGLTPEDAALQVRTIALKVAREWQWFETTPVAARLVESAGES